jgi:uncharacterized protein YgiM (DUF1202 family)
MNYQKITATLISTATLLASSTLSLQASAQTPEQLFAQSNSCRETNVATYLNIRNAPNGKVIARLRDAEQVYMTGKTSDGWVSISAPVDGYVSSKYLVYCANPTPDPSDDTSVSNVNALPTTATLAGENVATVAGDNCRLVNTNGLPVVDEPNGSVVGQLAVNDQVFIANEGFNGWVPIEAPINGYVSAQFLTQCAPGAGTAAMNQETLATISGTNCRQVMSPDVPLRGEPMGEVIGTLMKGQQVNIANEGFDGWVPVESPMNGYVTSANLGSCVN